MSDDLKRLLGLEVLPDHSAVAVGLMEPTFTTAAVASVIPPQFHGLANSERKLCISDV